MKSLNIAFVAAGLLLFSGCYTQLMIEDEPQTAQTSQPVIVVPPPVTVNPMVFGQQPDPVYVVSPTPVYVPVTSPSPISGYSAPAGSGQSSTVQRTSGEQRSGSASAPSASQNNSRSTGATRSGGR